MTAPHYVAKKVGDQYVLQRQDTAASGQDVAWSAVGGVLMLTGWVRGGPLGWLAFFGGASMVCRGVTGKNPFDGMLAQPERRNYWDPGPTHQNDARPALQTPQDDVDEAAMESFPASDPPARSAVSTVGGASSAPDAGR